MSGTSLNQLWKFADIIARTHSPRQKTGLLLDLGAKWLLEQLSTLQPPITSFEHYLPHLQASSSAHHHHHGQASSSPHPNLLTLSPVRRLLETYIELNERIQYLKRYTTSATSASSSRGATATEEGEHSNKSWREISLIESNIKK